MVTYETTIVEHERGRILKLLSINDHKYKTKPLCSPSRPQTLWFPPCNLRIKNNLVLTTDILQFAVASRDMFRPMAHKKKYLINFNKYVYMYII